MCPDQTDRKTDKEQTCRREDAAATVDFGLGFVPIRSYNENDIIPVLIGQQEGGGRWTAAGSVGESMKEYEETKGNLKCLSVKNQSYDPASGGVFDLKPARVFDVPPQNFFLFSETYSTLFFPSPFSF